MRSGSGQEGFFRFSEEEQQIFSTGVEAFSAPAAAALAAAYDFGRHQRVLDVAGGTGSFLIAIIRRHPDLRGTLFELPAACAVARRRLAHDPESARIEVIEGDLQVDPIPDGHDAVILANIVHGISQAHNLDLLRKVRSAVAPGARLLVVDMWMDASCTQPPAAPLMGGEFLIHSGEGQSYAEEDADGWLAQTGWRKLDRRPLAGPASVIIAEAA